MTDRFADREFGTIPLRTRGTSSTASARADQILARAEGKRTSPNALTNFDSISGLDKVAFLVAAVMTIGPLFAAFVGRMHS